MNSSDGSKKNKIVCRYGPSPTGNLHIGSARTALFIYLFAKSRGGKFLLRIDDTDLIKSNYDYTNEAIECLKWLGIKWDIGPIYQSRRFEIYKKYIQQLIDTGHAYYDESDKGKAVRFKMPAKKVEFIDLIHGTIKDDLSRYDDFIIQRSNGDPTYQIATVVDDYEFGVSFLPRGNDLFKSTHMQNALYEALGWEHAPYAHIPLVVGGDGKKLSKSHGATSVLEYKNNAYLPDALLNYMSMLGWAPKNKKEILTLQEMEKWFDYKNISSNNVVFDMKKLNWLNRKYMAKADKHSLSALMFDLLVSRKIIATDFDKSIFFEIVKLLTPRYYSNCDEFVNNSYYFFTGKIELEKAELDEISDGIMKTIRQTIETNEFTYDALDRKLRATAEEMKIEFGKIIGYIRYLLTGKKVTPDIISVMIILGKNEVIRRIGNLS